MQPEDTACIQFSFCITQKTVPLASYALMVLVLAGCSLTHPSAYIAHWTHATSNSVMQKVISQSLGVCRLVSSAMFHRGVLLSKVHSAAMVTRHCRLGIVQVFKRTVVPWCVHLSVRLSVLTHCL